MPEDTDVETGQVLKGMDSLPSVLRRYVREDNRWFQQELREWEEQFCQAQRDETAVQTNTSTSTEQPVPEEPQNPEPEPTQEQTNEETEKPPADLTPAPVQESEGQDISAFKGQMFCWCIFNVFFFPSRAHSQSSQHDITRGQWEWGADHCEPNSGSARGREARSESGEGAEAIFETGKK